ncbi:hypothetical protein L195_g062311, partial [Trifolium pratense]
MLVTGDCGGLISGGSGGGPRRESTVD